MNGLSETTQRALQEYFQSLNKLRDEGILINQKDFTCQIGEWLVETIYGGKRATSGVQNGWDVDVEGRHIQVKAHAKKINNPNRSSPINGNTTEQVDELIIIIFSSNYKIKEFYRVPWKEARTYIHFRGGRKQVQAIDWDDLKPYEQDLNSLPRQDVIQLFKE